jgi:hypothetical protein
VLYTFHRCVHSTGWQLVGRLGSYSVVPSRAFQNELGEQAPVGCRNPAGLSADCSSEIFKRSRQTELMLGLISMWQRWLTSYSKSSSRCLAYCPHLCPQIAARRPSSDVARQSLCSGSLAGWKTMAYIILEVIFKMSCLLSPSAGVKFADVPTQSWPSSGCFPRWIDNSAWVDWVLYTFHRCVHLTDLQLVGRLGSYSVCPRLRSKTLGVQAPVGCWNPAGLSADCSSEIFKRRRHTELMLGHLHFGNDSIYFPSIRAPLCWAVSNILDMWRMLGRSLINGGLVVGAIIKSKLAVPSRAF